MNISINLEKLLLNDKELSLIDEARKWKHANPDRDVIIGGSLALKMQGVYLKREVHDLDLQIPEATSENLTAPVGYTSSNDDIKSWDDAILLYKNEATKVDILYNHIPMEFINKVNDFKVVSPAWIVASKKYYILKIICEHQEWLMYRLIYADNIDYRSEILDASMKLKGSAKTCVLKHAGDLHVMNYASLNSNREILKTLQNADWEQEAPINFLTVAWQQFAALKAEQVSGVPFIKVVDAVPDDTLPF